MIFSTTPEIDWTELFGNSRPVEIEIGCGKGAFLLAYAEQHSEINLLGLERQLRWVRHIETRLSQRNLPNFRVLCADAAFVISRFVRDRSVHAYHLFFPDPWWKRRHHKRLLVRGDLPAHLFRTLEVGGRIELATDVRDRFKAMIEEFSRLAFEVRVEQSRGKRPPTNFERKYDAEGRPLYYATLRKIRDSAESRIGAG